ARSLFVNDTATTEIYTLSLHDALPISCCWRSSWRHRSGSSGRHSGRPASRRSGEHTSELQPLAYLVCRLLPEKKHNKRKLPATVSPRVTALRHYEVWSTC